MMRRLVPWLVLIAVLVTVSPALAEDPAAKGEEVKQLQQQLDQMSKELAEMKKLVESSQMSPQQRQMMMGHMGQMQTQMHGMMSNCCMMDPASCPSHMR